MITLITFGLFLFVLNLMFMASFLIFAIMFSHTLDCLFALFNVTMAVNSTTLKTASSFSLKAFFFVFHVHTLPLKSGRLNAPFVPSTTFFVLCFFKLLFPLAFGLRPSAPPHFSLIFDPQKHVLFIHLFNHFFSRIRTIFLFAFLVAFAFPTQPLPPLTNSNHDLCLAFILVFLMTIKDTVALIPLLVVLLSLVMLHLMRIRFPLLPLKPHPSSHPPLPLHKPPQLLS